MRHPCQPAPQLHRGFVVNCLLLLVVAWGAAGCASPPLTVTVPRIEHFTVANPTATFLTVAMLPAESSR